MITYFPTTLENYIETLYSHIHISQPYELDILTISERLNIKTYFFPGVGSQAMDVLGGPKINIDPEISPKEQWQDFGHELCHILKQYGTQTNMPDEFINFQEDKADNFALQFCIPTFMLERLELPQYRSKAIEYISDTFNVTYEFATKRIERHELQRLGSQYTLHIKSQFDAVENFKKSIECDYTLEDKENTYFINRNKGLVGVINNRSVER